MRPDHGAAGQLLELVRMGHGLVLLVDPTMAGRITSVPVSRGTRVVIRVLGVRHLMQGLATLLVPDPPVHRLGAALDTTHALSMTPLIALLGPDFRRLALLSGSLAAAYAVAEREVAHRGSARAAAPYSAGLGVARSAGHPGCLWKPYRRYNIS